MRKEDFLKLMHNEDEGTTLKLYDKLSISEKTGQTTFTNEFYTPSVWSRLLEHKHIFHVDIDCSGIFEDAERRVICFNKDTYDEYPVKLLCIKNKSKFHKLRHKDYLGAIMSLGIKREKVGDLIVDEDSCYLAVCEDIISYISGNLDYISHCPCEISEVAEQNDVPQYRYEEKMIITTSMRADCLTSSITGLSRSKSVDLIKSGQFYADYIEVREKDFELSTNSTVTIRGYGKFKIGETVGNSSSGRLKVQVKKFI